MKNFIFNLQKITETLGYKKEKDYQLKDQLDR